MQAAYTEGNVASIATRVNEAIDLASCGAAPWELASQLFADSFPGSFVVINNLDLENDRVNFCAAHNADPDYMEKYFEYYAYINPWLDIWHTQPSGTVLVAEDVCPARQFCGTEFYDDWVAPQKDIEGATGLKVDGGPNELLHVPVHYPLKLAPIYDKATAEVLKRIRGSLARAVKVSRRMARTSERLAASSAITARFAEAAVVVDETMRIREANEKAESALASGGFLSSIVGRLVIGDAQADTLLRRCIRALVSDLHIDRNGIDVKHGDTVWRISFTRLPRLLPDNLRLIVPPRRQCLILFRNITEERLFDPLNSLAEIYSLTPAEAGMCELLAAGKSLAEIADAQHNTIGTARQRLKSIFEKTDTHRQGELINLIGRFSR